MEISENRLKHILAVATKMKRMAETDHGIYPVDPDEAFVVGMLHDIGYEFSKEPGEHAIKGGLLLKEQGYKFWQEIYYHSTVQDEYDSPMLRLLNYADITTGPAGTDMTVQERIEDIADRYGRGSAQETEAIKMANLLKKQREYNKEEA
jgi:predicted hydrolase (HD superfamily)